MIIKHVSHLGLLLEFLEKFLSEHALVLWPSFPLVPDKGPEFL